MKKTYKKNKKSMPVWSIIIIAILGMAISFAATMGIYSYAADNSALAISKSWFGKTDTVSQTNYNGENLFNSRGATELDGVYFYDPITLSDNTDYVLTFYADTLESYCQEGAQYILLFRNELIEDISTFDMDNTINDGSTYYIMGVCLPASFKFSTRAYNFNYVYFACFYDLTADNSTLSVKLEEGLNPTLYTPYGICSTDAYDYKTQFQPEANDINKIAGANLFDATDATIQSVSGQIQCIYKAIELKSDTNYTATCFSANAENIACVLSDTILNFDDFNQLEIEPLCFEDNIFKFTTSGENDKKYLIVTSFYDAAETDPTQIKVEIGTESTVLTAYGVGTSELYVAPVVAEPTALVVAEQIDSLYINATDVTSDLLNSIIPDPDGLTMLLMTETPDSEATGYAICLMDIDGEATVLVGGNEETGFTLLWASAITDLSDGGISPYTEIGWQSAANGDLAEIYNFSNYYINNMGAHDLVPNFATWGNGDAELGEANFNALFSSTAFN